MINLSTPNEELLDELKSDKKKAEYWLTKHIGGERKMAELSKQLYITAKATKQIAYSDSIEYISQKGNRWFCGMSVGSPSGIYPFAQINMFVYYETYGSIGAFVPLKGFGGGCDSCVIFTSHFFYQFCDRAKIPYKSREMIMAFNRLLPIMNFKKVDDRGKDEILVRLPGGIGFGFPRNNDLSVIEIRTYLTDSELNKRQLRVSKDLREISDGKTDEGLSLAIGANIMDVPSAFRAICYRNVNELCKGGMDGGKATEASFMLSIVYLVFVSVGYVGKLDFNQQRKHFEVNNETVNRIIGIPNLSDDELFENLFTECAKNLNIKEFELDECMKSLHDTVDKIKNNKNE